MIYYNDPEHAEERAATPPLTEEEETDVIDYLNNLISKEAEEQTANERLLQQFVYNYENMKKKLDGRH